MEAHRLSRRRFMKRILFAALAAGLTPVAPGRSAKLPKPVYDHIPLRLLGKTEQHVPILGLDAAGLAQTGGDAARAIVRKAFGIEGKTVIDLVWDNGRAAELVSGELTGNRRKKLFLAAGTDGQSKTACLRQLSDTLDRLGTDSLDLWVVKERVYEADPDFVFSKDGFIGAAVYAREKKWIQHIGFAGYRNTDFFMAAMQGFFDFKVAEIPMNGMDGRYRKFQDRILPRLRARHIGTIVSDPIIGPFDEPRPLPPQTILDLLWSQQISVAAVRADSPETLDRYMAMARRHHTLPRVLRPRLLEKIGAI